MDIERAKAILSEIVRGTATKHPKVLISELASVVEFLLEELDRIKSPQFSTLSKRLPEDLTITKQPSVQSPWPEPQFPQSTPGNTPLKRRKGNAGDTE